MRTFSYYASSFTLMHGDHIPVYKGFSASTKNKNLNVDAEVDVDGVLFFVFHYFDVLVLTSSSCVHPSHI